MRKKDKLYEQLIAIAEDTKNCAQFFNRSVQEDGTKDLKAFANRVKELESESDVHIHEIIISLTNAFITPIEHEDILHLAEGLDEITDGLEECAFYFWMFETDLTDQYVRKFSRHIAGAAAELCAAVHLLSEKKLKEIKAHTVAVKTHEEKCDHAERQAIIHLFRTEDYDPKKIIELKELYHILEETADAAQVVAKGLDMIIMKNM